MDRGARRGGGRRGVPAATAGGRRVHPRRHPADRGGVPVPECLHPRTRRRPTGARVDPRRRLRDRPRGRQHLPRRRARAGGGRRRRDRQLPARRPWLAVAPGTGVGARRARGQLGPARPDRRSAVGPAQRRRVRRRPGPGDARRPVGGGAQRHGPARRAGGRRTVRATDRPVAAAGRHRAGSRGRDRLGRRAQRRARRRSLRPGDASRGSARPAGGGARAAAGTATLPRDPRRRPADARSCRPAAGRRLTTRAPRLRSTC